MKRGVIVWAQWDKGGRMIRCERATPEGPSRGPEGPSPAPDAPSSPTRISRGVATEQDRLL